MTTMPHRWHSGNLSIQERMIAGGNRTSGFDYLRILLSVSIICWHSISTSYGSQFELTIWRSPLGVLMHFTLPMFFVLSGFLVAASLDRCDTLISFFGLRILRIVPALAVEITLSALVLGPILTTKDLQSYFTSQEFFVYFLNMVGYIHYYLPGVFLANIVPRTVNAQLWTIPFELQCYLALGALSVVGIVNKKGGILLVTVIAAQGVWVLHALKQGDDGSSGGASGAVLVLCFLVGLLIHIYRDKIRLSKTMFVSMVALALLLSSLPHGSSYLAFPVGYITVFLGLLNPSKPKFLAAGDYSYGLYLYGFPIQQAFSSLGPAMHHWWINIIASLPCALGVAVLSWHFVERPALGLRRHLPALEQRLVGPASGAPRAAAEAITLRPRTFVHSMVKAALRIATIGSGFLGVILLLDAHEEHGLCGVAICFVMRIFTTIYERARYAAPSAAAWNLGYPPDRG
jgi:peptidoglycan/LPS O-acetylase OafA/YrhL